MIKEYSVYTISEKMEKLGVDVTPDLSKISIDLLEVDSVYESQHDNGDDGACISMKSGACYFVTSSYTDVLIDWQSTRKTYQQ